ncbi:P-loop containing nucleoside triphosphate hydrolase protein [Vararia minispora EC-137]|uniref:P-loop containing nucleoside triphosphate hydrolase protein n=1 Tax=Vararia minispora EC-137 TaxID=1314806 RepID=A0ACB8QSF3_9AGAM|nr:P-loop containing nucleoside triphosphate hydrolase protein [Vararia minispora EC-137]
MAISNKTTGIRQQREQLPIAQGKDAIVREISTNDVTIVLGETGSGKTTQIPQYLIESNVINGRIAVTQPRRVAATSLAARVSQEQGKPLGSLVGYSVRFDEKSSHATRIKYLTDGMLLREMMSDPLLERYSAVIVDEAHERTLRTDLVLASLKTILKTRNGDIAKKAGKQVGENPLKVVVMSATLDAEKFSLFFDNAKTLYVKGRQHPVTIYYTTTGQTDYLDAALRTFFQIHLDQPPGDVLIFLPGQEDIENLNSSIRTHAARLPIGSPDIVVRTLYASLPNEYQSKVFTPAPQGVRKCILATNIAETSITIPGVKYVIDTGKHKEKRHISAAKGRGADALLTVDITKSSAVQRAGRAGREGRGFCYRLYTEESFNKMPLSSEPEILRTDLTTALLQLKCVGQDMEDIDFMDRPDDVAFHSSLQTLLFLGALDRHRGLTELGRQMAAFPLDSEYSAIMLASISFRCTSEILAILSLMSASSPLFPDSSTEREAASEVRAKFGHASGDHITWLNVMRAYDEYGTHSADRRAWCRANFVSERALRDASDIRRQLQDMCEKVGIDWQVSAGQDVAPILQSLAKGLLLRSALLRPDGTYKQSFGSLEIRIHPGSALADRRSPAIVYNELVTTTRTYARGVSAIPKAYIASLSIPIDAPQTT